MRLRKRPQLNHMASVSALSIFPHATYHTHPREKGKTSDFAQYGAGVTSYFKFIKFCSWSFLVVSAAVVPHIFVNTNGEAITTVTTNADKMSWTTVGNLGSSTNFTSVSVSLFAPRGRDASIEVALSGNAKNSFLHDGDP